MEGKLSEKVSMKADRRCPDFSKDLAIKDVKSEEVSSESKKEKK